MKHQESQEYLSHSEQKAREKIQEKIDKWVQEQKNQIKQAEQKDGDDETKIIEKLKELQDENDTLKKEKGYLRMEVEMVEGELKKIINELLQQTSKRNLLENTLKDKEKQIQKYIQDLDNLNKKTVSQSDHEILEKRLKELKNECDSLKQNNESMQDKNTVQEMKVGKLQNQFKEQISNLSQQYISQRSLLENTLRLKEQEIQKYIQDLDNLKKNTVSKYDHEILEKRLKEQQQESANIIDLQQNQEKLSRKIQNQNQQSEEYEAKIQKQKLKTYDLEKQLQELKKKWRYSVEQLQDEKDHLEIKIMSMQQTDNNTSGPSEFQIETEKKLKEFRQQSNLIFELKEQNQQHQKLYSDLQQQMVELQQEIKKSQSDLEQEHKYHLERLDDIVKYKKMIADKDWNIKMKDENLGRLNNLDYQQKKKIQELELEIKNLKEQVQTLQDNDTQQNELLNKLKNQLLNQKGSVDSKQNQALVDELNNLQKKKEQQRIKQIQDQEDQQKRLFEEQQKLNQKNEKWEKEKKERTKRLQNFLMEINNTHGQLEVCFLVDCTGSMDPYKEQTMQSINGSMKVIKDQTGRDVKWSTICYQDYEELDELPNKQYQQLDFTTSSEELEEYLKGIKCEGGGDGCEDIRGGIIQMCEKITWATQFRLAILICDAPSHGVNSGDDCGDNHPNDDIKDAILMLIKKNITLMGVNFTEYTENMYSYIQQIFAEKNKQDLFHLINMEGLQQSDIWKQLIQMILSASKLLTKITDNGTKSKGDVSTKVCAIEALCKVGNFNDFENQDGLEKVDVKFKVIRVDIKEESFQKKLENIHQIQVPLDFVENSEGVWECIRTVKPFAFGMMKEVYLMKKKNAIQELYVIKTPLGGKTYSTLNDAITECRSHLISQKLMKKFTKEVNDACEEAVNNGQKVTRYPQIFYSDFLILEENPNSFWIAERFYPGEFVKYNNNFGYISHEQTELNAMAQAFSYYTFHLSNLNYMINDVQGVGIYFTDPAINSIEGKFEEKTDQGKDGQAMFMVNFGVKKIICKEILELLQIYPD